MSPIASLNASILDIPFKVSFRHASADRAAMQSLWVEARDAVGTVGLGEGCPRQYVTGESSASALAFVARHAEAWRADLVSVDGLAAWVGANRAAIDQDPAAWCAVELALLDLFGRRDGRTLESLLGLPALRGPFRYSAVLGDASPAAFEAQLARYRKAGMGAYKIKLSGDAARDAAKVAALAGAGIGPGAVRADANNLWADAEAAIAYLERLDFAFHALEEPLEAGDHAGMRRISDATGARIIVDESALREDQLAALAGDADRWIVNTRVSKMGGLLRCLALVRRARSLGISVIVGAHVGETSVLTRAALAVAQSAGDALLAQEGAFGTHLLERDPVAPCWMFGGGGWLDPSDYEPIGAGLGLARA